MMLYGSRKAGVGCDEVLHYNHSLNVLKYYESGGKDRSALETGISYLQYYGQSYDNISTLLIKIFNISNVYGFRHFMATLSGWLTILVTALFAVWFSGWKTGIAVIALFSLSPTFLGHSQNNLKDIPFALGYIAGIFFIIRFLSSTGKIKISNLILIILSIAFTISIRAGGILLICYLFLFFVLYELFYYVEYQKYNIKDALKKAVILIFVSVIAWFLSLFFWPYGLENPVTNPIKALALMGNFPLTFREIFEGMIEWTDYMPWYYVLKYIIITIPLTVLTGLIFAVFYFRPARIGRNYLNYLLLAFTVIFPLLYVIYTKANLYSGWRQLLFLYPGIVIFSATGITETMVKLKNKYLKYGLIFLLAIMAIHPFRLLLTDYQYAYIYFNQLVGGLKGANGNYETDYYFIGQREAAEWLNSYLKKKGIKDTIIVGSNFSAGWYFRDNPLVKNITFRNEERSNYDWDFYLSTNRYIQPWRLKGGKWPPKDALKIVYADGAPVCAVIDRKSKDSYYGFRALQEGRNMEAISIFEKALEKERNDEMIFYNFAVALNRERDSLRAEAMLMACLEINPFFEPGLMYAGKIAVMRGDSLKAGDYFEKLIKYNRKYFEAYVAYAEVLISQDIEKARKILKDCLKVNPAYKPALIALADSYRETDPATAERYRKIAEKIK